MSQATTNIQNAWNEGSEAYIRALTDAYLAAIDGELTAETITRLNNDQLTLLAYR